MTFQITIIGMDVIGASIGLALGQHQDKIVRVGHDRSFDRAKKAQKDGALDRVESNLPKSVADADLILLCEPYPEVLDTIAHLAPELNQGKYLFNLGFVHQAVNHKIAEIAPEMKHALNLYLTLSSDCLGSELANPAEPSADLFRDGLMVVATGPQTSSEAVDLAGTLAGILKTEMLFCDPLELEGMLAGAVQFPALCSSAIVQTVHQQSGWRETRKLIGPAFFAASLAASADVQPTITAGDLFENRENLSHWVDAQILELQNLRELLSAESPEALEKWLAEAADQRASLLHLRSSGAWEEKALPDIQIPSARERFAKLFTFGKRES